MDLAKQLFDDAWNQIRFAQKKIDDTRRSLREAGVPPDAPSLKLTEEALRKLSEATRAIVDLEYPKKEDGKMKRICGDCTHSCPTNLSGELVCFLDEARAPRKRTMPACEHFALSMESMYLNVKDALCESRKELPGFLPPPQTTMVATYKIEAQACRSHLEVSANGFADEYRFDLLGYLLFATVSEFLAEVANRDFERSLKKAAEVVAILYRTLNGDGEKKEAKQ